MDFTVEQMKDSAPAAETPFLHDRNLGKYQDHHNCMLYFSCDNKFMMNKDRYFMIFFPSLSTGGINLSCTSFLVYNIKPTRNDN